MFTPKQEKILEKAVEEGGVTQKMLEDIYKHRPTISTTVRQMVESGFLEEDEAPNCDTARKVYFPTEKTQAMLAH